MGKSKIEEEEVEEILRELNNVNVDIREKAASNLEDMKNEIKHLDRNKLKNIIPKLIDKLDDSSDKVRYYVAWTLQNISADFPELFKDKVVELMEKLNRPCEEPYRIYDRNRHDEIYFPNRCQHARYRISQILQNISESFPELFKDKISKLMKLLDDSNDKVRINAAYIFGNIGEKYPELIKDVIPRLMENMYDHEDICYSSLLALYKVAEKYIDVFKDKIDDLIERLEWFSTSEDIPEIIADLLHIIWRKYPNLVKEKIKELGKDLDQCKVAALCAIAYKHPELVFELIPKLKEALNDPDELIRERAAATLGNIGIKYPQLIEDIIPRLVELLIDGYPDTCEVTYDVLDDLIKKHPKTIEKIVPKLKEVTLKVITETSTFEEYYLENLTRLIKQIIIRKGSKAIKDLISKLIEKIDDPSEETRKRAIWTLREIGKEKPEIVKNTAQKIMEKLNDLSEKSAKNPPKPSKK